MIDPAALQTLSAVARTGSVGGAAGELGFTPSAVSQQVKRLERQVGGRLLDRVGRGVLLTELGRRLVAEGRPILDGLERLEAGLHAEHPERPVTGTVRLAAFSTAVRGLVGPALRVLRESDPGLAVEILEWDPFDALDLVARGSADAALVHHWGDLPLPFPDHLDVATIGADCADVLLPSSHPMAARGHVSAVELADDTWVCAPQGSVCHAWLVHMFDAHGRTPRIRHWATEFGSQIGLVAEEVAVALVPRLGRERLPDAVVAVPVVEPVPTRRVMLTWRRSMGPSPALARVRRAIEASAASRLDATEPAPDGRRPA